MWNDKAELINGYSHKRMKRFQQNIININTAELTHIIIHADYQLTDRQVSGSSGRRGQRSPGDSISEPLGYKIVKNR